MTVLQSSAETWDAIYQSGRDVRTWPSEDVIRFCARRLTPGMRVLDAGCGNGANLWFLMQQRFDAVGVDASQVACEAAQQLVRKRGQQSAVTLVAPLGRLGTWPAPFDAIIDCRASQHVPWTEHAAVYAEYYSLLKPGGWFFLLHLDQLTWPDAVQSSGKIDAWTWENIDVGVYPGNGVVCMPTRMALRKVIRGAGFEVAREESLHRRTGGTVCSHLAFDAQKVG